MLLLYITVTSLAPSLFTVLLTSIATFPPPITATFLPLKFGYSLFSSSSFPPNTCGKFSPSIPILVETFAPMLINTTSYSFSSFWIDISFPSSVLYFTSIPNSNILSIAFFSILGSNLNSGIPCSGIPPKAPCFSYIVTSYPFLAKNALQVRPAGPPPTTAIFLSFFLFVNLGISHPFSIAISPKNASTFPISTAESFILLIQWPWHWLSCGHILPHIAWSTVVLQQSSYASLYFFSFTNFINPAVSFERGQPSWHGFLTHSKQFDTIFSISSIIFSL